MIGLTTLFNQITGGAPAAQAHGGAFSIFEWASPQEVEQKEEDKTIVETNEIVAKDTIAVLAQRVVTVHECLSVLQHAELSMRDKIDVILTAGVTFEDTELLDKIATTNEILDIIRVIEVIETCEK